VHFGALDGNMQPSADLDALALAIATKLPTIEHLVLGFKASTLHYTIDTHNTISTIAGVSYLSGL
jgi:hypothetical protein